MPLPCWSRIIGNGDPSNLFMALGRYNGSRGQAKYPNMVNAAWRQWQVLESPP